MDTKNSKTNNKQLLQPDFFWRWVVITSFCLVCFVVIFGFLFFKTTQDGIDMPIVVQKNNIDQKIDRIEKRVGAVEDAVRVRVGN